MVQQNLRHLIVNVAKRLVANHIMAAAVCLMSTFCFIPYVHSELFRVYSSVYQPLNNIQQCCERLAAMKYTQSESCAFYDKVDFR